MGRPSHLAAARRCRRPSQVAHHSPDNGALSPILCPGFAASCGRHSFAYLGIQEHGCHAMHCGRAPTHSLPLGIPMGRPSGTPPPQTPALGVAPWASEAREWLFATME